MARHEPLIATVLQETSLGSLQNSCLTCSVNVGGTLTASRASGEAGEDSSIRCQEATKKTREPAGLSMSEFGIFSERGGSGK